MDGRRAAHSRHRRLSLLLRVSHLLPRHPRVRLAEAQQCPGRRGPDARPRYGAVGHPPPRSRRRTLVRQAEEVFVLFNPLCCHPFTRRASPLNPLPQSRALFSRVALWPTAGRGHSAGVNKTTNRADPLCPHAQGMADGEGFPDRAVAAEARNSVHPGGYLRRRQMELPEGETLSSFSSSSFVQFSVVVMELSVDLQPPPPPTPPLPPPPAARSYFGKNSICRSLQHPSSIHPCTHPLVWQHESPWVVTVLCHQVCQMGALK